MLSWKKALEKGNPIGLPECAEIPKLFLKLGGLLVGEFEVSRTVKEVYCLYLIFYWNRHILHVSLATK